MIKLELPIYWNTTKSKQELVSMNKYRNYFHSVKHKMKKEFDSIARLELLKYKGLRIKGEYKIRYTLFYKNAGCDLMNVISLIDKFFQDTLQKVKITENDNVSFCKYVEAIVGEKDKENPRVEIEIEEIREWKH